MEFQPETIEDRNLVIQSWIIVCCGSIVQSEARITGQGEHQCFSWELKERNHSLQVRKARSHRYLATFPGQEFTLCPPQTPLKTDLRHKFRQYKRDSGVETRNIKIWTAEGGATSTCQAWEGSTPTWDCTDEGDGICTARHLCSHPAVPQRSCLHWAGWGGLRVIRRVLQIPQAHVQTLVLHKITVLADNVLEEAIRQNDFLWVRPVWLSSLQEGIRKPSAEEDHIDWEDQAKRKNP